MNLNDIIFEKYLDGKIDDEHYLELLEKANIYEDEYKSFKVKKDDDMTTKEIEDDYEMYKEYEKLSNEARERMAKKYYLSGRNNITLTPFEYKIAKDYIKSLKNNDRRDIRNNALLGAATVANVALARANLKSNGKANKAIGAANVGGAAYGTYSLGRNAKETIDNRKAIRKGIESRNKK